MAHFPANFRSIALLFSENDRKTGLNSATFRYGFYSRTASWNGFVEKDIGVDVENLLKQLQSGDESERIYAAEDLGDLLKAEFAIPLVKQLVVERSDAVKSAIVAALKQVDISLALEDIFVLFDSTDAFLRNAAVVIFGEGGEEAVAFLTSKLDHSDEEVRKLVLDAMFETGSPETIFVIRAGLYDDSPNVKITAVEYLGRLADSEAVPEMVELFHNNNEPMLRAAILESLAMVGDNVSIKDIIEDLIPDGEIGAIDPIFLAPLTELTSKTGTVEDIVGLASSIKDIELYGLDICEMVTKGLKRYPTLLNDTLLRQQMVDIIKTVSTGEEARYQAVDCLLSGHKMEEVSVSILRELGTMLVDDPDSNMALPGVRLLAAAGENKKIKEIIANTKDDDLRELCTEIIP